jgi:hypothetical protein
MLQHYTNWRGPHKTHRGPQDRNPWSTSLYSHKTAVWLNCVLSTRWHTRTSSFVTLTAQLPARRTATERPWRPATQQSLQREKFTPPPWHSGKLRSVSPPLSMNYLHILWDPETSYGLRRVPCQGDSTEPQASPPPTLLLTQGGSRRKVINTKMFFWTDSPEKCFYFDKYAQGYQKIIQ